MEEATARFLVSDAGRNLLDEVAALPGDPADRLLALRKRGLTPEIAAGAIEVVDARRRARTRFPDADRLFWTRDALAQATSPVIAAYHAARLVPQATLAPLGSVADLGCGVGIDAVALAEAGAVVTAIERDGARLVFARVNAEVHGVAGRITFVQGDVTTLPWTADAAFWDPSRRVDGRRVSRHAEQYEPPLSFLQTVRARVRGGGVKLSPALPDDILKGLGGSVEFLSERGECKEACVWFGAAAERDQPDWAAVLLPGRLVIAPSESAPPVGPPGAFVHDPDPGVVRAGALGTLASRMNATLVDAGDAYLTSDTPGEPPLVSSYRVLDVLPYRPRALREVLRRRGVGRLVVKKRHFPREPKEVARELGLSGEGNEETLILVRAGHGHLAIVCEPVSR